MKILITGGAGFVGASLARLFKSDNHDASIYALDNLRRRGSELNVAAFKNLGIEFVHGDIRSMADLDDLPGNFDIMIEASAEPSVHAGTDGSPNYVLQTNLQGTLNCLEFARKRVDRGIFLSTSRVYSIEPLRQIKLDEKATRLVVSPNNEMKGLSSEGISEDFCTAKARSIYGATKLASELFVQEYAETFSTKFIVNRCGVIAGPGQFGKVDQGVFTLWVANHFFKKPLKYMGFGGEGKQVRDLLHPKDLYALISMQLEQTDQYKGQIFNVGGGNQGSTSLLELTKLCEDLTGNKIAMGKDPETKAVDIPYYITDTSKVFSAFNWKPQYKTADIISDIYKWIKENEASLKPIFG